MDEKNKLKKAYIYIVLITCIMIEYLYYKFENFIYTIV